MRVLLGFHFRNDPSGIRSQIFDRVKPIVESLYPWDEVVVMDSGHSTYNRAASRNMIAQKAFEDDYDVMVIHDADSIATNYAEAIELAYQWDRVYTPFDQVHFIGPGAFFPKPSKYRKLKPFYQHGPSFGGVYVCQPAIWEVLGGMDERIEGWGFEDQIFLAVHNTFLGRPTHVPGILYTVNHTRDTTSLNDINNDRLLREYHSVEGDFDRIRALQMGSNRIFA